MQCKRLHSPYVKKITETARPAMEDPQKARKGETPTLEDVARISGVSTATVSRCLNTPTRVSEATRNRVMEAVADLGYSPNFGARALAAKRTNTIGAIIPTMENAIFARALQAFQEELRQSGMTMLVASSSYKPEIEEEQIRTLVARGADGLLLIGHQRDAALYEFLDRQDVPTLVAWVHDAAASRPSIGFDNKAAMAALTREVLALGHRQIAMITAETAHNDRASARVEGARAELADAGLDSAFPLIETTYGVDEGGAAFADLMKAATQPTAVICGNDVLAVGAMAEARKMGLSVPNDVSITGFDDLDIARIAHPPLTTVRAPHQEMGREAANLLMAMVAGEAPAPRAPLQTEIQLRGTLAPPKGSPRPSL